MSRWTALVLVIFLSPLGAQADQNDPRLDDLFDTLQHSASINTIRATENRIWSIWLEHPDADVERLMVLGTKSMNYQRYTEALRAFSQVIENYPNYAEAWNKRATLYYLVGNLDASLSDVEHTLALEPRHFGALSGMGLLYIQREELFKAKQAFEDLIRIHPHSPNAQENLEMINESLRFNII